MTTLEDVISRSEHRNWLSRVASLQLFWVFLAAILACLALTFLTDAFASERNLFNVARNFAFVGIIAVSIAHTFNYDRDFYIPVEEVIATEGKRTELLAKQVS